jgi:phage virion morphogenesis protein
MADDTIALNVEFDGRDAMSALDRLKNGFKSKQLLLKSIGEDVINWSRDRITSRENTAPDGSAWESLAASTLRQKKKEGKGHQGVLMHEGRLWSRIKRGEITDDSVSIGSDVIHARIHQYGGMAGRGLKAKIPARPYLGISERQKEILQREVERWVKTLLEG